MECLQCHDSWLHTSMSVHHKWPQRRTVLQIGASCALHQLQIVRCKSNLSLTLHVKVSRNEHVFTSMQGSSPHPRIVYTTRAHCGAANRGHGPMVRTADHNAASCQVQIIAIV